MLRLLHLSIAIRLSCPNFPSPNVQEYLDSKNSNFNPRRWHTIIVTHNYCVTLYNRSQETSQRGKKNLVASYVSYISHAFRGILSRLPPQDSDAVGVRNNRPRRRIWRLGGMLRNRWTTKHSYSVSVWRQNVLALPRTKPLAVIIPCCQLVLLHPDTSTALS